MDTEGTVAAPFQGVDFIEYIVGYHKVSPKPVTRRNVLLTVANFSGDFVYLTGHLYVGGTFRVAFAGSPTRSSFDVTVSWSSANLEQFLNFDGCLYYQQQGPVGAYIFPRYNSWQTRYIAGAATINGVPLTGYDPTIGGYRGVNSHDVASSVVEVAVGEPFSAEATCGLGTVMLGFTFNNPNWTPPQPYQVGFSEDYGYIFAAVPRYLFVPLTQGVGGASISNMVCPTVDELLGSAGLTPYLPTITSNGDGTTSPYDPTTFYPPFTPPP